MCGMALSAATAKQPYAATTLASAVTDVVVRTFTAPTLLSVLNDQSGAAAGGMAQALPVAGEAMPAAGAASQLPPSMSWAGPLMLGTGAAMLGTGAAAPGAGAAAPGTGAAMLGTGAAMLGTGAAMLGTGAAAPGAGAAAPGAGAAAPGAGAAAPGTGAAAPVMNAAAVLMAGAAQQQQQTVPRRAPGSRATGTCFAGQKANTGRGGKGIKKCCQECRDRTGQDIHIVGHICPFKNNTDVRVSKKRKSTSQGGEAS
ncbi:hypothetical protein PLESTB_001444000 [Pleodorina starrii]|uniref:Uncharacterized protein n=1 Tax=Pleodorina starrii TaxID=330485 RepID=A0A9W6F7E3_9CHLO|nr:hypothetical protein PLESTB_001444000 [Pleodorina starrii]